jgi:hypothetical protein
VGQGRFVATISVPSTFFFIRLNSADVNLRSRGVLVTAVTLIVLVVLPNVGVAYEQQTLPVNQAAVDTYVSNLIGSYNAFLQSKQEQWSNFPTIQHDFVLYAATGYSFKVLVARENASSKNDRIDFLFQPIQAGKPDVIIYQNETGQQLRAITVSGFNNPAALDYFSVWTPYGSILEYVKTNASVSATYYPLIWITNTSQVYNDPNVDSKSAAQAIYNSDANQAGPFPTPSFWDQAWAFVQTYVIEVAFGVIGVIASLIAIRDKLPHRRSKLHKPGARKK